MYLNETKRGKKGKRWRGTFLLGRELLELFDANVAHLHLDLSINIR